MYFLAHNGVDVFHYGELLQGQEITTGQPQLEYFEELDYLKQRLINFGVEYNDGSNLPEPLEPTDV
jgi:hypothetical protein